jgi:hypothetical protein
MQKEFVAMASMMCPFLGRTSVNKLRKLASMPASKLRGCSGSGSALVAVAGKCPVLRPALKSQAREISTSSKCPYASIVDDISVVGAQGKVRDFLKHQQKGLFYF